MHSYKKEVSDKMILNGDESKHCPDCREDLPLSSFTRNARMRDGLSFYCAPCARKRVLESRRRRLGPPRTRNGQGPSDVPDGHKWCPECNVVKALDDFPRNKRARNGRGSYCKPCHNRIGSASREANGGARNYHLRRRYGITAEHADRMLAEQGGLCAICREAPAEHFDHDHATDRVRGLLCFNCNGALGQFRDRRELMLRAVMYLDDGPQGVLDALPFEFALACGEFPSPRPAGEPAPA